MTAIKVRRERKTGTARRSEVVQVSVTRQERERLERLARQEQVPLAELGRRALRAYGSGSGGR